MASGIPAAVHIRERGPSRSRGTQRISRVVAVNPDLVVHDKGGEVYTVRYDAVNAMLLNEFLKEHRTVQEQGTTIAAQKKEIDALRAELKEQRALIQKVSHKVELERPATRTVLNNR